MSNIQDVHGSTRDVKNRKFSNLTELGVQREVTLHSASLIDFRNLLQLVSDVEPDEIYNLAGQSSVSVSFSQPMETMESIAMGSLQILEVIRYLNSSIRFYNAGSSECFGEMEVGGSGNESSPFRPRSPYAAAKAAAFWATANYREAYDLFACSGILFNHESPLRPEHFVTKKIVSTAVRIANGEKIKLHLGRLDIWRDWGYAGDYVDAMWRMLQQPQAEDFVIATGESHSLQHFVELVFDKLSLDYNEYIEIDRCFFRPSVIQYSKGNAEKALHYLEWEAKHRMSDVICMMINAEKKKQAHYDLYQMRTD